MKIIRSLSAILLALPLIVFGSNYFFNFFSLTPSENNGTGEALLQMMVA